MNNKSALVLLLSVLLVSAETIIRTYHFDEPEIIDNTARLKGCYSTREAFAPCVPVKPVKLLVPRGHDVVSFTVSYSEPVFMKGDYYLKPFRPSGRISVGPPRDYYTRKSNQYNGNVFYPAAVKVEDFYTQVKNYHTMIKEDGSAFPEKESYISLKAGGYTRFQVRITTGNDAFNSFTLTVEDNTLNLSFDSLNDDVKTLILYPGVTPVTVYSHNNYSEGEAEFSVTANSRNGEICLAGRECETGEDGLVCVVYRDIVYYNYQLYCVNNPSFNPDTNEWKEEFNKVIKQAVLNIESVEKRNYNNSDWDDNGNGILDLFVSKIDVPSERLEHERLLASIENTYTDVPTCYTGCPPNEQEPKTMILPGTIRRNWLILEDANKGDSFLILNSVVDLKDSMEIFIRAWGGSPEYNVIKHTDPNNSIILRHPLSNSYPAYSSVVTDCMGFIRGFTIESCTWVEDLESYRNVIHEFCHFKAVGPLSHAVKDNSNVMFPLYGDYGTKLRYRYLETDDLFDLGALENQWKQLHTIYPY